MDTAFLRMTRIRVEDVGSLKRKQHLSWFMCSLLRTIGSDMPMHSICEADEAGAANQDSSRLSSMTKDIPPNPGGKIREGS